MNRGKNCGGEEVEERKCRLIIKEEKRWWHITEGNGREEGKRKNETRNR